MFVEAGFAIPGELELFSAKENCSVSEFAAKHRPVTLGAHIGSWDNSLVPYLTEIMDTAGLAHVEELVICGPPQSGKTNACLNILLHHIYRYGGNGKYCMFPTEQLAKLFVNMRLKPVLERCPVLMDRMQGKSATTLERIAMSDGTFIFPAWGTSAAKLSSFGADFVWADEVDKNSDLVGDESDPLTLLEDRVRTFRRRKMLKCSTPTVETGLIWQALNRCADVREYHVTCPHCDAPQQMRVDQLTWPGQMGLFATGKGEVGRVKGENPLQPDQDPELLKSLRPARYVCEACGSMWDDLDRNIAVRRGQWVSRGERPARPRSVGFHISGFISPDISLSDIAAAICAARGGDIALERRRDNSILGVPHRPQIKAERKEDAILALRDDRPEGLVPSVPIAAISCVADMQKRGFWYSIRAWGFGFESESWLLKHGFVDSWQALERVMFESQFKDVAGNIYIPNLFAMDSGGGESEEGELSRTAEAYLFGCRHPQVLLFKGNSRMTSMHKRDTLDKFPGTNKPLPGTATMYAVNSNRFKNELAAKLQVNGSDPGAWHLHSGLTDADIAIGLSADDIGRERMRPFARQMCAEVLIDGKWENPNKKDNHFWDIGYYELALANIVGLRGWARPEDQQQISRRVIDAGV